MQAVLDTIHRVLSGIHDLIPDIFAVLGALLAGYRLVREEVRLARRGQRQPARRHRGMRRKDL